MDGPLVALWEAIHGVPYPREADHTDALAALHALGIPAQLELAPSSGPIWAFASPDDARAFARQRLWLGVPGHDPRADALLDDWLVLPRVYSRSGCAPRAWKAARGCAMDWRQVAVICVVPRRRMRPMAVLRKAAMTWGA